MKKRKMIKLLYFLLISNLCFSQQSKSELVLQEFYIENTQVRFVDDEWHFIDVVYSHINLLDSIYILDENQSVEDYLQDVSSDLLMYKYYTSDIYTFTHDKGLTIKAKVLSKINDNYTALTFPFTKPDTAAVNVHFDCNSQDIDNQSVIYVKEISGITFVIEKIENYFYLSFFNKNCNLMERIKVSESEFLMYENSNYFVLKTNSMLIVFTPISIED